MNGIKPDTEKNPSQFRPFSITQTHEISPKNEEETQILKDSRTIKKSPFVRQCIAVLGPLIVVISSGMVSGYSAILIPQVVGRNTTVQFTEGDVSWIAAVGVLPMGPGCFLGGYLMNKFGRRTSHMIICVPMVLGWALIACSEIIPYTKAMILLGRFITGAASGILGPPSSVYMGEISDPKYRALFLGGISLSIAIGVFIAHILGTFLTWKLTAAISSVLPLFCYVLIVFVPESPTWLLAKDDIEKAERAFKWFRGNGIEAIDEFQAMVNRHLADKNERASKPKESMLENMKVNFSRQAFIRPLVIILIFFSTIQFSGVNAVVFYSVSILNETLGSGINEYLAMILIDTIRVIMSIVACICMKNFGRRPISLIGTGGTAVSFLGLALFLYLQRNITYFGNVYWPSLTCFISFVIFTTIGLVPMAWCLVGELFPVQQRGLGSGISTCWNFIAFFIVVKTYPALSDIGLVQTFSLYGSIALAGVIYLWFELPETKNKTLQEIEDHFTHKHLNDNNKLKKENNNIDI